MTGTRKSTVLLILASGFALLGASPEALATQCAPTPLATAFDNADYVFEGTVTARNRTEGPSDSRCRTQGELCGSKVAGITVNHVWKGALGPATTVYSRDACLCLGSYFEVGDRTIIFAMNSDDNQFELTESDDCGATQRYTYRTARILDDVRDGKPVPARVSLIVEATVLSSEIARIDEPPSLSCGYKQSIQVNETFRGPESRTREIATSEPLTPGHRYLLHLDNDPGRRFGHRGGDMAVDDQRKIFDCIQTLPEFRSAWPAPMRIFELPDELIDIGNFHTSPQSGMPASVVTVEPGAVVTDPDRGKRLDEKTTCYLLEGACQDRGLVPWPEFRTWIMSMIAGGEPVRSD